MQLEVLAAIRHESLDVGREFGVVECRDVDCLEFLVGSLEAGSH